MEQLFSQFADLPKLKKEQGDVLQLFKEVEERIVHLSQLGQQLDMAKGLAQLSRGMKEFDSVLDKGAGALDKVGSAIQKNSKFTLSDIEAIKKAKGVTDDYVASLVKLAQSKQVYAEGHKKAGQQREKPMSGFQLYMGENMKAGSGKSHTQVSDEWTALDEQMKALWNYAAQFTKFGAVAEGVGASLDSAAQHAKEHAQESKAATSDVKAHTEALKDNTEAADDNATAADKWAKAIEAQKARAAGLVAGVSSEPVISRMGDSLGENATQRDALKAQLDSIRQAKKELAALNQGEFAGQFTEDINALAEAEERLKIQIQQANRFVANQARELQASEGSLDSMRAKLNQMLQAYDAMGAAGKNSEAGQALNKQINDITVAIKEGEEGTDRYFRSVGKYAETLRPLFDKVGAQIEKLKQEQKELQAQGNGGVQNLTGQRNQVGFQIGAGEGPERLNQVTSQLQALETIQQAAAKSTGSYAQQVRVLDSALDEMARSGGSSVGFVLEMKEALQDAKIQNLGNFEGSAKIIVQAFEEARVKVKSLSKTMSESAPELQGARAELEALSRVVENPQFLNVAGKVGDAVSEVRHFTKALIDLEKQGQGNSQAAINLRKRLAELTDEIADVRSEVKAMSSDTRGFDLFASSVGTVASSFEVAITATEIFGESNEDVQRSIQKLVAVQSLSNGVRAIATDLTTKGSAANKAYAFIQGLVATSLDKTAAAGKRAQAALGLIGIAATVIGGLVIAYQMMSRAANEAAERQKRLSEVIGDAKSEYARAVTEVESLRNNIQLAKEGFISKEHVVKQYNETLGKTTGEVKNLEEAEKALEKNAEAYIRMTYKKALANAALQKAVEKSFEIIENNNKKPTEFLSWWEKANLPDENAPSFMALAAEKAAPKLAAANKKVQKEADDFMAMFRKFMDEAAGEAGQNGWDLTGMVGKVDVESDIRKLKEQMRKINHAMRQQALKDQADLQKALSEIPGTEAIRVGAREGQLILEKKIAKEQTAFELNELAIRTQEQRKKAETEITDKKALARVLSSIEQEAAAERSQIQENGTREMRRLQTDAAASIIGIRKQIADRERADMEEASQMAEKQIEEGIQKQADAAARSHEKRLLNAEEMALLDHKANRDNFEKGLITQEQYAIRSEQIETDKQRKILESQIKFYQAQIDILAAAGKDVTAMQQALAEAQTSLFNLNSKGGDDIIQAQKDALDQLKEKYRELGATVKEAFETLISGTYDAEINKIQERMALIDELKNKEIERINAGADSEENKAKKIKVIEARAQADREALQKRQSQVERQKAIFDKSAKGFQIATDGIVAVNKIQMLALSAPDPVSKALYAAQIPLAIAASAAQLVALLATPLPKFFVGTDYAPEGFAEIAERGRELVVDPEGNMILHEKKGVTYLKEGSKVFTNEETEEILRNSQAVTQTALKSEHRPLTSYLTEPMIPIEQVYQDLFRITEQERKTIINLQAPKEKPDRTEEVVERLDRVTDQLKDLNKKSWIFRYNDYGHGQDWIDKNIKR